jgi:hypothetical protein
LGPRRWASPLTGVDRPKWKWNGTQEEARDYILKEKDNTNSTKTAERPGLNPRSNKSRKSEGVILLNEKLDQQQPVENRTLASEGQGVVVIVKPTGEDTRTLFNDPIEITDLLDASDFGKSYVKDIRINKKKAIITVELKKHDPAVIQNLLTITKLGTWDIQVYLPNTDKQRIGVISPVHIGADLLKIQDRIIPDILTAKVLKLERLRKKEGNEWVTSSSVKVTFACTQLPKDVVIGRSFYRVRPYVFQPVQCFRCQRLGHTARSCKGKVRCLLCSEGHDKEECLKLTFKCAGCGGEHKANSKECLLIQEAILIEERKADGETHAVAHQAVLQCRHSLEVDSNNNETNEQTRNKRFPLLHTHSVVADVHHSINSQVKQPSTYARIVSKQISANPKRNICDAPSHTPANQTKPKMVSHSTQTEADVSNALKSDIVENVTKDILKKLVGCLTEVFTSSINIENQATKQLLLKNIMQNYFGSSLTSSKAEESSHHRKNIAHNVCPPSPKQCNSRRPSQGMIMDPWTDTDENEVLSLVSSTAARQDISSSDDEFPAVAGSSVVLCDAAAKFLKKSVDPTPGKHLQNSDQAQLRKGGVSQNKQRKKKKVKQ